MCVFVYVCLLTGTSNDRYWKAQWSDERNRYGRYWYYRPVSADVETTSYALLTTLLMGSENDISSDVPRIVKWLSKQRNGNGGFSTTQVYIKVKGFVLGFSHI